MKLIIQIAFIILLACHFTLPSAAETTPIPPVELEADKENAVDNDAKLSEEEEIEAEATPVEESEIVESLTMQHRVKEETLPKQTLEADLMVLLQTLKDDVLAQLKKHGKPLAVDTEVNVVLSEEWSSDLDNKQLPSLSMKTTINEQGQGKSEFTLPTFKRKVTDEKETEQAVIDWKGLQGQLTFPEKLENLTLVANTEGFRIVDGQSFAELGKTTFNGEFDADLFPTLFDFSLPSFKFNDADDKTELNLEGIVFKGKTEKSKGNLSLGQGALTIAQFNLSQNGAKSHLKGFELKGHGELQEDTVRYVLNTKVGQLLLPEEVMGEKLEMSYASNLELRRLDATVVAEIQKTAQELRKQKQLGTIGSEMLGIAMMGKAMEVLPRFLAKSPELALTELNLKTAQGNLQGKMTVGIDGKKAVSLDELAKFIMAIKAQADFTVAKALFEKVMASMVYEDLMSEATGGAEATDKKPDEAALRKQAKTTSDQQIKEFLTKKYIVESGDHYQLVASLLDGKLNVNGQVTEISELFKDTPVEEEAEEETVDTPSEEEKSDSATK